MRAMRPERVAPVLDRLLLAYLDLEPLRADATVVPPLVTGRFRES